MSRLDRELPEYHAQHNLASVPADPASDPGVDPDALAEPSYHQRQRRYRKAIRQLREIAADDARLHRRAQEARRSVFPSSGGGGSRHSGISDPTYLAAERADRRGKDPSERALDAIDSAIRSINAAARHRQRALYMGKAEGVLAEFEGELDDACAAHERAGMFAPRGDPKDVGKDSPLCQWCHRFNRTHGQWPARELLRILDAKGRVTVKEVERSLRAAQPQTPPE